MFSYFRFLISLGGDLFETVLEEAAGLFGFAVIGDDLARRPIAGSQTCDGGIRSASVAGAATSSGCGSATSAGAG